jgi:hypothetical protein
VVVVVRIVAGVSIVAASLISSGFRVTAGQNTAPGRLRVAFLAARGASRRGFTVGTE